MNMTKRNIRLLFSTFVADWFLVGMFFVLLSILIKPSFYFGIDTYPKLESLQFLSMLSISMALAIAIKK